MVSWHLLLPCPLQDCCGCDCDKNISAAVEAVAVACWSCNGHHTYVHIIPLTSSAVSAAGRNTPTHSGVFPARLHSRHAGGP